jgi:Glycosyl transferase family 2
MPALVSVGIPAYNRPAELERAVRSVLAQDHDGLEVLVSDDASPDASVAEVGERLARDDPRVRFERQERNLGHVDNYRWVLEAARGEYFMWLSDDDYLDSRYVSRCLATLQGEPGCRLACGQALYRAESGSVTEERPIDLRSRRPGVRVVRYFARVNMNGPLFGLARRADLLAAPFQRVPGGDWMLVSALAARGTIRTLRDIHLHRSPSGLGSDPERLGRSFGLSGRAARYHHVPMAARLWKETVRRNGAYGSMHLLARVVTATIASALVILRFTGLDLARTAGLGSLERRAIGWIRARDRTADTR